MPLISDSYHNKKLKEYGINIKTKYIVGNKILERNTDNSNNDDITSGIRTEKDYFIGNNLVHKEKEFDSRIEYTFISQDMESTEYTCPNCGMKSKIGENTSGCSYCGTYYNVDYSDKDLGSKYHYDRVLRSNKYRIITGIIDLIISIILAYFFIKATSRTFNNVDIIKVFVYGLILSLVLYYGFYILDGYIILGPIKRYKDRQNQKQIDFWNRINIDKKNFFNNFNYEVRKYYYSKDNIIDFDVLDYLEFSDLKDNENQYIKVKVDIRLVYYENGKITSKVVEETYKFKKNINDKLELKDGVNIIKCHNCGASIEATSGSCSYCGSEIKYLQEWILVQ